MRCLRSRCRARRARARVVWTASHAFIQRTVYSFAHARIVLFGCFRQPSGCASIERPSESGPLPGFCNRLALSVALLVSLLHRSKLARARWASLHHPRQLAFGAITAPFIIVGLLIGFPRCSRRNVPRRRSHLPLTHATLRGPGSVYAATPLARSCSILAGFLRSVHRQPRKASSCSPRSRGEWLPAPLAGAGRTFSGCFTRGRPSRWVGARRRARRPVAPRQTVANYAAANQQPEPSIMVRYRHSVDIVRASSGNIIRWSTQHRSPIRASSRAHFILKGHLPCCSTLAARRRGRRPRASGSRFRTEPYPAVRAIQLIELRPRCPRARASRSITAACCDPKVPSHDDAAIPCVSESLLTDLPRTLSIANSESCIFTRRLLPRSAPLKPGGSSASGWPCTASRGVLDVASVLRACFRRTRASGMCGSTAFSSPPRTFTSISASQERSAAPPSQDLDFDRDPHHTRSRSSAAGPARSEYLAARRFDHEHRRQCLSETSLLLNS